MNTKWADIDDSKVQIDFDELKSMFGVEAKPEKPKVEVVEQPKTVEIIDSKKSRSVAIMLAKFRMDNKEIAMRIKQLQSSFTDDQLAAIKSNLPEPSELNEVKEYTGDQKLLGVCEKYFLEIGQIRALDLHVELMLLLRNFKTRSSAIIKPLDIIMAALKEIQSSAQLEGVLTALLRIGNIMNGATARGGAYGFKLEFLGKLQDVRSQKPGETMMHFLLDTCEKNDPTLLTLDDGLADVQPATKVDLDTAKNDYNQLSQLMLRMRNYMKIAEKQMLEGDMFYAKFEQLDQEAKEPLEEMKEKIAQIETLYKETIEAYGESPETLSIGDLFVLFNTFTQNFVRVRKEVEQKRAEIAKQQEKEQKKRESEAAMSKEKQRGVLDTALEQLQTTNIEEEPTAKTVRRARIRQILANNNNR